MSDNLLSEDAMDKKLKTILIVLAVIVAIPLLCVIGSALLSVVAR